MHGEIPVIRPPRNPIPINTSTSGDLSCEEGEHLAPPEDQPPGAVVVECIIDDPGLVVVECIIDDPGWVVVECIIDDPCLVVVE